MKAADMNAPTNNGCYGFYGGPPTEPRPEMEYLIARKEGEEQIAREKENKFWE